MKRTQVLKELVGYPATQMTGRTEISLELVVSAMVVVRFDIDTVHIATAGIEYPTFFLYLFRLHSNGTCFIKQLSHRYRFN